MKAIVTVLALLPASYIHAADPSPIQQGKGHPFVCTDYSQGKIFIVSADGKAEWDYPAPNSNDLWVLPNGNLLFVTGHGVKEVTREKKVVFSYQSKSEIYACQRLDNGNTFIAECNAGRLLEVDPSGKIVKEVRLLPEGKDGGHAYIRNARQLANGNYLVTHYGEQVVREYDPQGKVVREIRAPGGPHSAIRLANGNTLIACGDLKGGPQVLEVDPDGKTVWQVAKDELPGISLKFMTGLQRLPNGNTVMSNWLGHGQFGKAPHVIEVTPAKKVVWTFADHQTMKTISSVQLLDVPGDVTKGEIAH
jgi:outer membrane protein assembly factor BamB